MRIGLAPREVQAATPLVALVKATEVTASGLGSGRQQHCCGHGRLLLNISSTLTLLRTVESASQPITGPCPPRGVAGCTLPELVSYRAQAPSGGGCRGLPHRVDYSTRPENGGCWQGTASAGPADDVVARTGPADLEAKGGAGFLIA